MTRPHNSPSPPGTARRRGEESPVGRRAGSTPAACERRRGRRPVTGDTRRHAATGGDTGRHRGDTVAALPSPSQSPRRVAPHVRGRSPSASRPPGRAPESSRRFHAQSPAGPDSDDRWSDSRTHPDHGPVRARTERSAMVKDCRQHRNFRPQLTDPPVGSADRSGAHPELADPAANAPGPHFRRAARRAGAVRPARPGSAVPLSSLSFNSQSCGLQRHQCRVRLTGLSETAPQDGMFDPMFDPLRAHPEIQGESEFRPRAASRSTPGSPPRSDRWARPSAAVPGKTLTGDVPRRVRP